MILKIYSWSFLCFYFWFFDFFFELGFYLFEMIAFFYYLKIKGLWVVWILLLEIEIGRNYLTLEEILQNLKIEKKDKKQINLLQYLIVMPNWSTINKNNQNQNQNQFNKGNLKWSNNLSKFKKWSKNQKLMWWNKTLNQFFIAITIKILKIKFKRK